MQPRSGAAARDDGASQPRLQELRETNEILETKVKKLEQLLRLKDSKIQALVAKVQSLEAR